MAKLSESSALPWFAIIVGEIFVEFFPNAKQENLFIDMLHGFREMCIPQRIVTDNMKSVVIGRALDGSLIWQKDYEQFMTTFQF